jgi:hypothetical protein
MSLPDSWVNKIFDRMLVTYGAKWARLWEGVDIAAVKADWAQQLEGFDGAAIFYALRYLPTEHPPTVLQFRDLCRKAPVMAQVPRLEAPKADPERVRELLKRMAETIRSRSALDWAYDLQRREQEGEALTPGQRAAWRDALAHGPSEGVIFGEFSQPAPETLPPGMRAQQ